MNGLTLVELLALFGWSWLAALAAAVALAPAGVVAVARDQPLRPMALAQAAAAACACGLFVGAQADLLADPWIHRCLTVGMGIAAALVLVRGGILADLWTILAAGAVVPLVLGALPHGRAELDRLLWSSLLSADPVDAVLLAVVAVAGLAAAWRWQREIAALVTDPGAAVAHGLPRSWAESALAVWLGGTAGLALEATGALCTAALLILPALAARAWCRTTAAALLLAPALGAAATVAGLAWSLAADLPPGQAVAVLLAALAAVAAASRR